MFQQSLSSYDTKVQVFGEKLYDTFVRAGRDFVVETNAMFSREECQKILKWMSRSKFKFEPINFDSPDTNVRTSKRYLNVITYNFRLILIMISYYSARLQKLICEYQSSCCRGLTPPPFLKSFFDVLLSWHGNDKTVLVVKELLSKKDCPVQEIHCDGKYDCGKKRRLFVDIPFSLLMALEPDSNITSIVRETNRVTVIHQGAVAVWRADYFHAGARYVKRNRRMFIAIVDCDKKDIFEDVHFKLEN
jgi:hypothetical protein